MDIRRDGCGDSSYRAELVCPLPSEVLYLRQFHGKSL